MCGILGIWSRNIVDQNTLEVMLKTLHHRGPDDHGTWTDRQHHLALGHARLSIQDLSPEGHQPMISSSGRYVIVFNGEIYNFLSIKNELRSARDFAFRGGSDTEILLAAIEAWGIEAAVKRCVGMFAIAVWDKEEANLSLVRDRFGEKPLYYGKVGNDFVFASELKALAHHPAWSGDINHDALASFLQYSYVPTPLSIYNDINKLEPGTIVCISADGKVISKPYWSAEVVAYHGIHHQYAGSYEEAKTTLNNLLEQSIAEKMIADVPLGAFLSGGIDSSLTVALMQKMSSRAVKTFSIGYHNPAYNEAAHAKAVAQHLGVDHTELYLSSQDCLDVIPMLGTLYDEPFADPSQIPTYLVAKMAKQHVTVALTGDGGDELFGGYNRYLQVESLWKKAQKIPYPLRYFVFGALQKVSPSVWSCILGSKHNPAPKVQKFLRSFANAKTGMDLFRTYISTSHEAKSLNHMGSALDLINPSHFSDLGLTQGMMLSDAQHYMMDDVLVKVDRASMGGSLEARVPFLDHRIFEFAWMLPLAFKIQGKTGKCILRDILYDHIPKGLMERPKTGFDIPISQWLCSDIRAWAESLILDVGLYAEYLDHGAVQKLWHEFTVSKHQNTKLMWNVLMFLAWLKAK